MTDVSLARSTVAWPVRPFQRPARLLFACLRGILRGSLEVHFPDGEVAHYSGAEAGPRAVFQIVSMRFAKRLSDGDIGFAEGFMAGEWNSPDLVALLDLILANRELIERFRAKPLMRLAQRLQHWSNRNSRSGSRRNISAHYDLGNAFYERWLDKTMTYSSGVDVRHDLAAAQTRKYERLARSIDLRREHHVLEIGCGWGGFAAWAARNIGCRITAITISREQFDYAQERIERAGLNDLVTIELCDYRDISGQYDRIVSIEMFEAVGEAYWASYVRTLRNLLVPGGEAALQIITIREDLFVQYRKEMDFIRAYVFPGGMLPTRHALNALGAGAGMRMLADEGFGADYARTCAIWRANFERAWSEIQKLGFDERFRRLWNYYLAYCEAGFRAGTIDVRQIAWRREG